MDTLLPTQMFPRLPAHATFVADTNFVSRTQKMFLILVRNILCPQQMFPSLHNMRYIMSNNVSSFASTFMRMLMSLLCPVRTCWPKHKHKHSRKTISQSLSTNAYVNDVLTKHKHKKKASASAVALLTSAQASYAYVYACACVASEDWALVVLACPL